MKYNIYVNDNIQTDYKDCIIDFYDFDLAERHVNNWLGQRLKPVAGTLKVNVPFPYHTQDRLNYIEIRTEPSKEEYKVDINSLKLENDKLTTWLVELCASWILEGYNLPNNINEWYQNNQIEIEKRVALSKLTEREKELLGLK